ncbi:MAG: hypothetical protein RLZZ563_1397 [Pseudomonadota bacterium]
MPAPAESLGIGAGFHFLVNRLASGWTEEVPMAAFEGEDLHGMGSVGLVLDEVSTRHGQLQKTYLRKTKPQPLGR